MDLEQLINKSKFTVLLGKNGAGKSTILRNIDTSKNFNTKYISPERGGTLKYDSQVDNNIFNNDNWLSDTRRQNRAEQFRQQSSAQFRNLETMVLREIEKDAEKRNDMEYTFDTTLKLINELLPQINIIRADKGFDLSNDESKKIDEDSISSGESELIVLTIEVLVFSRLKQENKILLLDEPDVHLHPDLQQKFIEFVEGIAVDYNFKVILATHSTAIVGAFSEKADLQIVPISKKDQSDFSCFRYDLICHEILPVFGAHPLSSQFNRTPVLLVEGEDDKRVFDQVMRSSEGKFRCVPCVVGTVSEMAKWEKWLKDFLPSIYDDPKAYSIRDLDGSPQADINDIGCVIRSRLNCYAIENILLTNECLTRHKFSTRSFCKELDQWAESHPNHETTKALSELIADFGNRRTIKIKDLRNIILANLGTSMPWEVLVGQLIEENLKNISSGAHSISTYLGEKVIGSLLN